jgi:hypothetical protein
MFIGKAASDSTTPAAEQKGNTHVTLSTYLFLAGLLTFGTCLVAGCGGGDSPSYNNSDEGDNNNDNTSQGNPSSAPFAITSGPSAGQTGTISVAQASSETATVSITINGHTTTLSGSISPGSGVNYFYVVQNGYQISGGIGSDGGLSGPGMITFPDGSTASFN